MQNKQKLFFSPKEFFISLPKSFIPLTRQSPPFDTETKERYSDLPPANPRQHIFILLLFVSLLSPRPAAPPRVGPALPVLRAAGRPLWEEAPAELTAGNGRRWRRRGSSQHPFCPFLRTTRCTQRLPGLVVGCFFVVWVVFFFFSLSLSYLSLCIFCYYFLMPGQFFSLSFCSALCSSGPQPTALLRAGTSPEHSTAHLTSEEGCGPREGVSGRS